VPVAWVLNPNGGDNVPADGAPSFAWNELDQTFEVVWAQHDGADFEIVLSKWETDQWSVPVALTSTANDDTDPVIAFAPDGTARVVFQDDTHIYMLTRPPGGSWGAPVSVDLGARPSTARTAENRAAFQHAGAGGTTEIVAAVNDGSWQSTLLQTVTFAGLGGTGNVDVRIGSVAGRVWIVWEDSATQLGWSQLVGGFWTAPQYETIAGAADEEAGRLRIKLSALQ